MLKHVMTLAAAALLCACATTPDVTYYYYPAKSRTNLTVTQSVVCNADKTALIFVNTPQITTIYSANHEAEPYPLKIKSLDSSFANANINFGFYDDGRLKSVNQSTTGQGEAIIKAAISVVSAGVKVGGGGIDAKKVCTSVEGLKDGKPVTLIYSKSIDLGMSMSDNDITILLDETLVNDKKLFGAIQSLIPAYKFTISRPKPLESGAIYLQNESDGTVPLTLQKINVFNIEFKDETASTTYDVLVPGTQTYRLPIPKAALFGAQKFVLALSDAGAITSIEYGKDTGTAGFLNSVSAGITAATPTSAATEAAEIRAQADLIAQQQRLARCKAQPGKCQ